MPDWSLVMRSDAGLRPSAALSVLSLSAFACVKQCAASEASQPTTFFRRPEDETLKLLFHRKNSSEERDHTDVSYRMQNVHTRPAMILLPGRSRNENIRNALDHRNLPEVNHPFGDHALRALLLVSNKIPVGS